MKLARDILSLSTFKRDSNKVIRQILRERLASRSHKKGRPAEDSFNEFFAENNIPVED